MTAPLKTAAPIPLVDLALAHAEVAEEIKAGWHQVIAGSGFIHGPEVSLFEKSFAAFVGVAHCVGVANGTDAIEIALRALGVGAGDEVVLPANTFIATAFAVLRCGATPVLVDVDPQTMLIDPAAAADRITARCRAVIPVHLFGQLAPMAPVLSAAGSVPVVEDAAQAQGATQGGKGIGAFGAVATTSFYPGKNLGAYGDGGAILTGDPGLADRMRRMANHGSSERYEHPEVGFNSRLDTLQAVVLQAKLARLAVWNAARRAAAARYDELLTDLVDVRLPTTAPDNEHVWHLYTVRLPRRDEVLTALHDAGIGAGVHYPKALHLQGALASLGHTRGDFPVTEDAADSMISLPLFPRITADQQQRVAGELRKAMR